VRVRKREEKRRRERGAAALLPYAAEV